MKSVNKQRLCHVFIPFFIMVLLTLGLCFGARFALADVPSTENGGSAAVEGLATDEVVTPDAQATALESDQNLAGDAANAASSGVESEGATQAVVPFEGESDSGEEPQGEEPLTSGFHSDSNGLFYINDSGDKVVNAWIKDGGKWFYFDENGYALTQPSEIDGKLYCFDENGVMQTGWVKDSDGRWYFLSSDGSAVTGWKQSGGKWYYLSPSDYKAVKWGQTIGGKRYYFNGSCVMRVGWLKNSDSSWSYYAPSGAAVTGWRYISGDWYYFDGNYKAVKWGQTIGGKRYYFNGSCAMHVGWLKNSDSSWSYYDSNGAAATGWRYVSGDWYYLGKDYKAVKWSQTIGGKHYYFNADCSMRTGWLRWANGTWSYFGSDGAMYTGKHEVGDAYYDFGTNGIAREIKSSAQEAMEIKAQGYRSSTNWLILVNNSTCRVGIYYRVGNKWVEEYYWKCSPGRPSTPTVKGQFTVGSRGYSFDSGAYTCYYYTQFYGNYLFHSTLYWKGTMRLAIGTLGQQLSHGCVRLDIDNAKWINRNIPSGTKVVSY